MSKRSDTHEHEKPIKLPPALYARLHELDDRFKHLQVSLSCIVGLLATIGVLVIVFGFLLLRSGSPPPDVEVFVSDPVEVEEEIHLDVQDSVDVEVQIDSLQ